MASIIVRRIDHFIQAAAAHTCQCQVSVPVAGPTPPASVDCNANILPGSGEKIINNNHFMPGKTTTVSGNQRIYMARFLIITFAFAFRVLSASNTTRIYPSMAGSRAMALSTSALAMLPYSIFHIHFHFHWRRAFYASNKESEPNNPSNAQLLVKILLSQDKGMARGVALRFYTGCRNKTKHISSLVIFMNLFK